MSVLRIGAKKSNKRPPIGVPKNGTQRTEDNMSFLHAFRGRLFGTERTCTSVYVHTHTHAVYTGREWLLAPEGQFMTRRRYFVPAAAAGGEKERKQQLFCDVYFFALSLSLSRARSGEE